MAKTDKKKSNKEASNLFHDIMGASVSGNPKPENKSKDIIKHIQEEIAMVVPEYGNYLLIQISQNKPYQISYEIWSNCPVEKADKIRKIIHENAALLELPVSSIDEIE